MVDNNKNVVLQLILDNSDKVFHLNTIEHQDYQSIEYCGGEAEITDLITHLNRKFKKDHSSLGFKASIKGEFVNYIDVLIKEGMYEITKGSTQPSNKNLFYLISKGNTIDFGTTNTIYGLFSPSEIDYSNSFLIEGKTIEVVNSLVKSMKLDFGITDSHNINFDKNIIQLLQTKINILLKKKKIKSMKLSSALNKIDQLLTSSAVCEILQISKQTLSKWRKSNKIKFVKQSDRIFLYNKSDVLSLLTTITTRKKTTLNSNEVCEILHISKQLLMYWRKTKKIKFKVISNRNIIYEMSHIQDLLTTRLRLNHSTTKHTQDSSVEVDIIKWITVYSHQVTEQKYLKQLFFLNFGNVGIVSSPQVMISNDFKLIDVIHGTTLIENPTDVLYYLKGLNDKALKPLIDTSKEYYDGFGAIYLNKLYKGRVVN